MNMLSLSVLCRMIGGILIAAVLTGPSSAEPKRNSPDGSSAPSRTKYITFSTDAEAYYVTKFRKYQGDYSQEIVDVCEARGVPFTWLSVVDAQFKELNGIFNNIYTQRKGIDEFSLHGHFKWYIMDHENDFESYRDVKRRLQWLRNAKKKIQKLGLPMPVSFRYGAGDTNEKSYYIEDLIFLHDELGVKNLLCTPDQISAVKGSRHSSHLENNVWEIDGGRKLTIIDTAIYLDSERENVLRTLDDRIKQDDYVHFGSHDYRTIVPQNMDAVIQHLAETDYDVKYVTVAEIGELIRADKIKNGR